MPKFVKTPGQERAWARAKEIVAKEYGSGLEKSDPDKFYALTTQIFKSVCKGDEYECGRPFKPKGEGLEDLIVRLEQVSGDAGSVLGELSGPTGGTDKDQMRMARSWKQRVLASGTKRVEAIVKRLNADERAPELAARYDKRESTGTELLWSITVNGKPLGKLGLDAWFQASYGKGDDVHLVYERTRGGAVDSVPPGEKQEQKLRELVPGL